VERFTNTKQCKLLGVAGMQNTNHRRESLSLFPAGKKDLIFI